MTYNIIPIQKLIHKILSIKYNKYLKINFTEIFFKFLKNKIFFQILIFLFYSNTIIFPFNVTIYLLWLTRKKILHEYDRLQVTPVCQDSRKRLYVKRKTCEEKKRRRKRRFIGTKREVKAHLSIYVATIKVKAFLPDARVRPRPRSLSRSEKEKPKLSIFFLRSVLFDSLSLAFWDSFRQGALLWNESLIMESMKLLTKSF